MTINRRSFIKRLGLLSVLPGIVPHLVHAASPQRIGVIGAGWLGSTVGRRWVSSGHSVMFSSRHPEQLALMARKLGAHASVGTAAEAAAFGSILLLAVPFDAVPQVGRELKQDYQGKITLDATNPWGQSDSHVYREAHETGVAQTVARYFPGARLVRAFSAVDATVVASSGTGNDQRIGMPIASNDSEALRVAAQLVRDAGCDPVITGNLASAAIFQPGGPGFRAHLTASELRRRLGVSDIT